MTETQRGQQRQKRRGGKEDIADHKAGLTGNIVLKGQPQIVKHDVDQIPDTKTQREQVFTVAAVPYLGQGSIHERVLLCFLCNVLTGVCRTEAARRRSIKPSLEVRAGGVLQRQLHRLAGGGGLVDR